MKPKSKHGGKRAGAGPHQKYLRFVDLDGKRFTRERQAEIEKAMERFGLRIVITRKKPIA